MINLSTLLIESAPTYEDGAKYLLTKYRDNKNRIKKRFIDQLELFLQMNDVENYTDIVNLYSNLINTEKPFTYKEALEITKNDFSALVFSVINVPEMIKELGTERIKTDGVDLINKLFVNNEFIDVPTTLIYELHKVNGEAIGLTEEIFAIKCWCISTNQEHWLWIDKEMGLKSDPLEAIASTCKIYESMKNKIKHIIRQGDVFLFEMTEEVNPSENENIISLDKNTYFKLLKSQS